MVDGWFIEPDPNPIQSQVRIPRIIVPAPLVICPALTSRFIQGLLPRTISARDHSI
jgi:hypothetical protein